MSEYLASPGLPSTRPRLVLLSSGDKPDVAGEIARLRPLVAKHAEIVMEDASFSADLQSVAADFAVVLGGDGSILHAAHQMGFHQIPVVGVNLGKLGFLADLSPDEFLRVLPDLGSGNYRVVEHLMFECRVVRGGKTIHEELGLNEAVIFAGPPFSILDIHLYVDAELATTYSCDGLIVSTPVGSTAHSLSAGGPILRKSLSAFVISPISPHTLTNRPVVDAADRVYELAVPRPHDGTSLVVDGRTVCTLSSDDRVRIEAARASFKLVEFAGHGYYRTLREKLGWRGQLQKP